MNSFDLHIVHEHRDRKRHQHNIQEQLDDPVSDWLEYPERWDRQAFVSSASSYMHRKNGRVDIADGHLLGMLASQIEIYVQSVLKLRAEGLVVAFNGGMTLGPNPYIAIADKALHRILQVMKELELSPKSRDGYQSNQRGSPELRSLLDGP